MVKYEYQLYYRKEGNKRWFKFFPFPYPKKEIDALFKKDILNIRDYEYKTKRIKMIK